MRSFSSVILALAWGAAVASATPTVAIHWSDCSSTTVNRSRADGPTATIVVTVRGLSGGVRHTKARMWMKSSGYTGIPDFWRFDPGGCQIGGLDESTGGTPDCPPLAMPSASIGWFASGGEMIFAAAYPTPVADPTSTYTIGTFTFDLSDTTCACADQPQCFFVDAAWIDDAGVERQFFPEQEYLTWNNLYGTCSTSGPLCGNPADCADPPNPCSAGATPAARASWGRVRANYR